MLAWQHDGIGRGQESITLIAYDEAGIEEAVGNPVRGRGRHRAADEVALPRSASLLQQQSPPAVPPRASGSVWSINSPDRVLAIQATPAGLSGADARRVAVDDRRGGKLYSKQAGSGREPPRPASPRRPMRPWPKPTARPDRLLKLTARVRRASGRGSSGWWTLAHCRRRGAGQSRKLCRKTSPAWPGPRASSSRAWRTAGSWRWDPVRLRSGVPVQGAASPPAAA